MARGLSLHVGRSLADISGADPVLRGLLELTPYLQTVVFGGWVRDRIVEAMHGVLIESPDIDIVVLGDSIALELPPGNEELAGSICSKGRVMLTRNRTRVDVWTLANTFTFARCGLASSLGNLPLTTVFDVNAVWYNPRSEEMEGPIAEEAIARRIVGFNNVSYLMDRPELQAFRALSISSRLQFALSSEVSNFIGQILSGQSDIVAADKVTRMRPHLLASEVVSQFSRFRSAWRS